MKNFKIGDKVNLYPGDTYKKVAVILDINNLGWEFKMVEGTSEQSYEKPGEIIFISHSKSLSMTKMQIIKAMTGVLRISAKCSDLCWTEYTDRNGNETNSDGYVPQGIGIDEPDDCGDYVSMEINMETGQILNWKPVTDEQVIAAQKKH